jgi:hypothetical protein
MNTYRIELRLDPGLGLRFVGIDEVNDAISQGAEVIRIEAGEAILDKVGIENEKARLLFSGWRINVVVEE